MLDFGAGEFVVVGVVALIAIGPKELPSVLRAIGRSVGKMRRMAGDFQNQFNDAMRDMELEEARKKMEEMSKSVSDSVQTATHLDLPQVDLPKIDLNGTEPTSVTPAPSGETVAGAQETGHSILGALPDLQAPSSETLLAQAQSEAQSLQTPTETTPSPLSQEPTKDTPPAAPEPAHKGVSA